MSPTQGDRAHRRALAIDVLGGCCVRCGITYPLDIDHITNKGGEHRRAVKAGLRLNSVEEILLYLEQYRRPHPEYQLLDPNCNALKERDPDTYWNKAPAYGMLPLAQRRPALRLPLMKRLVYRWVVS